jgi:hypothetical protein
MLYPRQTTSMKALHIVLHLCSTRARCYLFLTDHKAALKGLVQYYYLILFLYHKYAFNGCCCISARGCRHPAARTKHSWTWSALAHISCKQGLKRELSESCCCGDSCTRYWLWHSVALHTIESDTTLYSAVFAAAASIRLAHDCGLTFKSKELQCIAGRVADVPTLRAACELGLALTDEVLFGAAESGSVSKLQWFHIDQGCQLPPDICNYAAKSGSIHVLSWLKEHGSAFTASACANAAGGAYLHLLRCLRDESCEWSEYACALAAKNGHLSTVVWLHEQGCPWKLDEICGDAAESGSIELLIYLKQQGCELNEYTIAAAAQNGRLAVCQFLVAEQCPWNARACAGAAAAGHLETARFLLESGCPWEPDTICARAAESDSIELLQYLKQQGGVLTESVMSMAAYMGNLHVIQYLHSE